MWTDSSRWAGGPIQSGPAQSSRAQALSTAAPEGIASTLLLEDKRPTLNPCHSLLDFSYGTNHGIIFVARADRDLRGRSEGVLSGSRGSF